MTSEKTRKPIGPASSRNQAAGGRVCRCAVLAVACVGLLGCRSAADHGSTPPDPTEQRADTADKDPGGASPATPDVNTAGFHRVRHGAALAFQTGMTAAEADDAIREAVGAGLAVVSSTTREQRQLAGLSLAVVVREIDPLKGSEVSRIRLTFFEDVLVGVVISYRAADPQRVLEQGRLHGPGVHGDGWVGWWLLEADRIVQCAPDGTSYEVFDLAAARSVVPEVDTAMLDSWRRRYKVPPAWAIGLVPQNQAP